ncbi:MAG: hypothetical protein PHY80_02960 [Rickettsiales bacterium]|nr:hypothetical protein [Rickettsiales bacterium]
MKKILTLKIYNYFHYILIVLIFACITKFVLDFYNKNKDVIKSSNNIVEYQNIILEPRLQFNDKGFQFVEAEQGIENNQNYTYTNVKTYGDFGEASAGQLEITDNQNVLTFTENPSFTIYTNKIKK